MRVWISAILIAILAGALPAGNWSGHDDIPLTSGGDMPVAVTSGAPDGRELEFAFGQLLRAAGAEIAGTVGQVRFMANRDAGKGTVDATNNRDSPAVYGFGLGALLGNRPAQGGNVLRQMFNDISLGAALPAIDRFTARVWFGF